MLQVMTSLKAIQRLHAHNPDVILVLVLRNPVERAYSSFWFARQMGWENIETFEDAVWSDPRRLRDPLAQSECAYLDDGTYSNHIKDLFKYFSREQVLVFLFDVLKKIS